jgi:hypothetical protein
MGQPQGSPAFDSYRVQESAGQVSSGQAGGASVFPPSVTVPPSGVGSGAQTGQPQWSGFDCIPPTQTSEPHPTRQSGSVHASPTRPATKRAATAAGILRMLSMRCLTSCSFMTPGTWYRFSGAGMQEEISGDCQRLGGPIVMLHRCERTPLTAALIPGADRIVNG